MNKLILHCIRVSCILFTWGSNISLLKEITAHIMGHQNPDPNIKFSIKYQSRFFNIFLNHKLMCYEWYSAIRLFPNIVVPVKSRLLWLISTAYHHPFSFIIPFPVRIKLNPGTLKILTSILNSITFSFRALIFILKYVGW